MDRKQRNLNLSDDENEKLDELKKITGMSKSKLLGCFIVYFYEKKDTLEIKRDSITRAKIKF